MQSFKGCEKSTHMSPLNDHDNAPVTHRQHMQSAIFPIIQITVLRKLLTLVLATIFWIWQQKHKQEKQV